MYCVPLSLLAVSALRFMLASSAEARQRVDEISGFLMPQFHEAFSEYLALIVERRGTLGLAGFGLAFLMGSMTFGSVRTIRNTIFRVESSRSVVHGKIFFVDLLMVLLASLLVLLIVGLVSLVTLAQDFRDELRFVDDLVGELRYGRWNLEMVLEPALIWVGRSVGFFLALALFGLVYRFAPARTITQGGIFLASLAGTVLFELSKEGFRWYVQFAQQTTALYGALSAVLFFLMWLCYVSVVFVMAAEIGWAYQSSRCEPPERKA